MVYTMTAGTQGNAYDKAAKLAKDNPNDKALQTAAARAKETLNASLAAKNQKLVP